MSLILDALKRVERQRRVERAPDLSTLYEAGPERRRRIWPWLLLIVVLALNLLLLGYLLRSDRPGTQTATTPKPSPVPTVMQGRPKASGAPPLSKKRPHKAPVPTAGPAASPPPSLPALKGPGRPARPLSREALVTADRTAPPRQAGHDGQGTSPAADNETDTETQPETPPPATRTVLVKLPDSAPARLKPAPVPSVEAPAPRPPGTAPAPDREETAAPRPGRAAVAEPSAASEGIPLVKELPKSVRDKLTGLKINVHAYYQDPAESFVFINMRRYRAGDRIGRDGPTLEAITQDGVVLDYGGGKALLLTVN